VSAPRFLLSGYYGFGNLGDEALLAAIVDRLGTRYPGATVNVLSHDPVATAARLGVEATARADVRAVRNAIARADVVLSGGGGLLQDATSVQSLLYYAGIVRAATGAKKRTMIFAQSIGPLGAIGRGIVRATCRGISAATVRDEASRRLLSALVPNVRVERTADPVFLLNAQSTPLDLRAEGLDGPGPLVVVSVRRWHGHDATATMLAAVVDRLAEAHGAQVAFLPLGGPPDADAATTVIRRARSTPVLLPDYPFAQAQQVLARATLVIGMRLHALIFAARLGVPFTALPYDPKVTALLEDLRYPLPPLFTPGTRGTSPVEVFARLDDAWARRDEAAAHLRAVVPEIERLAERNFEVLDDILQEGN
jgi:polysaccharide pyruvyl transferase CsaB